MSVTEIAPDVYRLSLFVPEINLQFNQFLVVDDEPLLYHTGMNAMFPVVLENVSTLVDPAKLRWIGFSHYEADECGSLNKWLELAPNAEAVCSTIGAMVSVNDTSIRPARGMADGDTFSTGRYNFRFIQTPHLPHCWDAGLLFEETNKTLFCSDLLLQSGEVAPFREGNLIDEVRDCLTVDQTGPYADGLPYTQLTKANLTKLAALDPKTFAVMHGSSFGGNGAEILSQLDTVMHDVLCGKEAAV